MTPDATGPIRLRARRRLDALARQDPAAAQAETLRRLLRRAAGTRFGAAHGFAAIRSVAQYQRIVQLTDHEGMWRTWWAPGFPNLTDVSWPGRIPFFAETSGTARDVTKFIPVSRAMCRANARAALDILAFHLASVPDSRVMTGRTLILGGSTALRRLAPGVRSGDLSGIAARVAPHWARPWTFPPPRLALEPDWPRKIDAIARAATRTRITALSGVPSWLLVYLDALAALRPDRARTLAAQHPALALVIHGGVGFAPYATRFEAWLAGSRAETREVYAASEGFVAIADRGPGEGMRPLLDNGLFLEFVPREELGRARPVRHWIGNAEPGVDYALALTSNAGLWSCLIGDTVRLVSRDPPRLLVTGRLAHDLSVFGEHLSAAELDRAMAAASAATGVEMVEYAVSAEFPQAGRSQGRHVFAVEFAADPPDPARFAAALDDALAAGNADYRSHRAGDLGLAPPALRVVPAGGFARWMAARGRLGGQNKVPRVIADPALFARLLG